MEHHQAFLVLVLMAIAGTCAAAKSRQQCGNIYIWRNNNMSCPHVHAVCADVFNTRRDWFNGTACQEKRVLHNCRGVGSTVACESALRSAATLLSRVRAPLLAPWPDGGPESVRSSCCGLAIYKKLKLIPGNTSASPCARCRIAKTSGCLLEEITGESTPYFLWLPFRTVQSSAIALTLRHHYPVQAAGVHRAVISHTHRWHAIKNTYSTFYICRGYRVPQILAIRETAAAVPENQFLMADSKNYANPRVELTLETSLDKSEKTLLCDLYCEGQYINAARYCSSLDRLKEAIHRKSPGLLRRGVVLQHDNATPHSANLTQQWLQRYGWEILPHPAHSPDLAPSEFHLFGPLKRPLGGMAFETEDDLISELRNWFDNLEVDFFRVDINSLLSRWQKCIDLHGDYVKK
ncbi:histone-lysine N-methyltransferase SETMAR [Plakobranchus ocellatus]|uniref:Histone-lysine N-methyltransferase SETMAR n=1 Tax=Plakobranchus ocellatus TaxID=259542 RepID=A0AAV3ZU87_9GAST|nr:histone-lysine N-methyltransferase SETMAR [Plakobranchus ocellatus]